MKTNYYTILILTFALTLNSHLSAFSSSSIKQVFANNNFQIAESSNEIDISISKNPWESFTFAIDNMDILDNPVVQLDLLSKESINLRIDLTDGNFVSSKSGIIEKVINGANSFQSLSFDFTNLVSDLDLSGDIYLVFYVNPGKAYTGKISIKNLSLNPETTKNQTPSQPNGFDMFPSPATSFTNVEIPEIDLNTLKIIDMGGRTIAQFDISSYTGSTYRVELNNLPKGHFTVQLTDGKTTLTEKLIIN